MQPLDRDSVMAFIRKHGDGVLSTLGPDGSPQSAYLTLAVTDRGEIVLDAREASRKVANPRRDGRVAVVVGGRDGVTLQAEGLADIPRGLSKNNSSILMWSYGGVESCPAMVASCCVVVTVRGPAGIVWPSAVRTG
ncbi:pyridoxamine 5'-phosphate oxidase family protein, partial [Streptomyces sp. NPDC056821]|uniref:pyridoxamine 5'-phosphate oxidase family protein n=1 Tax=unclassified Streptomyces TaxID=2593676 RepID=UPI0036A24D8C